MEVLKILEHFAALANLVHDGIVRRHELAFRLVVRADAVHDTRQRALSEVIAHEVIQLRSDDAQTLFSDLNRLIELRRELRAALIYCVRFVHDATAKGHAACEVVFHFSEHVLLLREH